jgi:anaerobic selenocysteine-containing dehydrogenase
MELGRRRFIQGVGALGGTAAAGVAATPFDVIAQTAAEAKKPAEATGPSVKKIKSGCAICPNFCGIEGTVVDGVLRTIYPDAGRADYYNHGICPKGASGMFNTYDPYRLKKPLKRTNPKKGQNEDPKWVEISWDQAFSEIAGRLNKLRADNPAKLVVQYGQGKYLIQEQFPRAFAEAFGTPNTVHRTTVCEAARHVADDLTWGYHGHQPDLKHTNLLLNFGANYHEGEQSSRWLDWATANARERGMKAVVFDPRLSGCAAKADEWVPVRPGKDVAAILAMAKILIDSGTVDQDFLITYTNAPELVDADGKIVTDKDGKTSLVWDTVTNSAKPFTAEVKPALKGSFAVDGKPVRTGFQVLADSLAEMTPQYAEEVSGIPATTITRLALSFGKEARIGETIEIDGQKLRYRPVAAYTFRGLSAKEFGVQSSRSAVILNMLVGALDAVGGVRLSSVYKSPKYMEPAKCEFPPTRADLKYSVFHPNSHHDVAQQPNLSVLDAKAYGLTYTPEMQIFYATNRPVSTSNAWQQFEGLKKTYNVVIDVVMSESCHFADIVLPDKTYLESWHYAPTRSTPDASHKAIRQPMVNPYNLEQDAFSIFWELAKRLDLRDKYAESCNKQWDLKEVKFKTGRDYTAREAVEVIWSDQTKKDFAIALEKGFVGSKNDAKGKYLKGIEDKFKGPGKPKMKLYADQMIHTYEKVASVAKKNGLQQIDLAKYKLAYAPLPSKEHAFPTPHREAKDFPLYLITHKKMYRNQSGFTVNNVILNQALGKGVDENAIAVNTTTAQQLKIKSGDSVVIETRVGKVKGVAQVVEGIRPDTIAVSYHFGQWSPGYAKEGRKGTWINQVLELHPDVASGMNSFNDTKCKLYKA